MRVTRYFEEQVLQKRPYLTIELCQTVIDNPVRQVAQADGRIRSWGRFTLSGEDQSRMLRVVTLPDGTLHNAFLDRGYREDHA